MQAAGWKSENNSSLGQLWLEVLRYFSLGFDTAMYVVCLRQHKMLARAEKKWNSKKLAIEGIYSDVSASYYLIGILLEKVVRTRYSGLCYIGFSV